MPEYLSPGVYIEEVPGPQPIQGVSTSTTGMVGVTQKGPTAGKPELVTSFAEFRQQFGGYLDPPQDDAERVRWEHDDLEGGYWWRFPLAVKGFFDNGGRRLYVKRVVSSAATPARVDVSTGVIGPRPAGAGQDPLSLAVPTGTVPTLLRAAATAEGSWGNDLTIRVRPSRARRIRAVHPSGTGPRAATLAAEIRGSTTATLNWPDRLGTVTAPVVVEIGGERFDVATVPAPANGQLALTLPRAPAEPRRRGDAVKVFRAVDSAPDQAGARTVPLASTSADAVYQGALVLVGHTEARATISGVAPAGDPTTPGSVQLTPVTTAGFPRVFESDHVQVVEATVDVRYEAGVSGPIRRAEPEVVTERFAGLRLDQLTGTPRSIVDVVNAESNLVRLEAVENTPPATVGWSLFPGSPDATSDGYEPLAGGDDHSENLRPDDFAGEDGGSGRRTGIQAMEDIDEISLCAVPGMWSRAVQAALIAHCQRLKDRFAILDAQRGLSVQEVQAFRQPLSSEYAALYHPWLTVRDPTTGTNIPAPPSGHLAGLYAAVDNDRGVHKAPANVVIQQIVGLDDDINQREQDVLNPVGINALRSFPNRGLLVWGARTLTAVPEWTYISVRRLFIYIEKSIKYGTQWVVFEPNGEPLWALVTQAVTNFLDTVWRTGALQGLRQAEAFYVRCDRSTMSQDDIDNGRLVVEIGIAAVRPAEFVIFRFRQKTREQVAAV